MIEIEIDGMSIQDPERLLARRVRPNVVFAVGSEEKGGNVRLLDTWPR